MKITYAIDGDIGIEHPMEEVVIKDDGDGYVTFEQGVDTIVLNLNQIKEVCEALAKVLKG